MYFCSVKKSPNMLEKSDVFQCLVQGEGLHVEFKQSVPVKVRELSEEVCGFANAQGGVVLIGISDSNEIVGTTIENSRRSAIQGSLGEISPKVQYSLYPVEVDDKTVWVIEVPEGQFKPYVFAGSIYMREGASCQKLTQVDEMRDFFQRSERIHFDAIPEPAIDLMDELDEDAFHEFRRAAGLSPDTPIPQILDNLQLFDESHFAKRGSVMFFAKHPEAHYFQAVVRCVLFKGNEKVYILDDKTFSGPLLRQYEQALDWLQSKLQVSYRIETAGPRQEIWEIPLNVLKEALLNAICHRDYYEQGATVVVEMYDDRVEISNPGGLLPIVAKNFGRKSLSRNPLVFNLFTRMSLAEKIGSGIPRMRKSMLDAGLPEPVFETEGFFTVTLSRPTAQAQTAKVVEEEAPTTEKHDSILSVIRENPTLSSEEIIRLTGLKRSTFYNHLNKLKESKKIKKVKKDGKWQWVVK